MSFVINYNFYTLPKIEHECDFEYDPELDNIITFTQHFFTILEDNNAFNFSIFINDIDLFGFSNYYFDILIEQLPDAIESIEYLDDFYIDFFEDDRKGLDFELIDEENYLIEVLEVPGGKKLVEFGSAIVRKDYIYNLFLGILKDFIRVSKIYCEKMYNNEYFQETFADYIE